jgi:hypothetical protein
MADRYWVGGTGNWNDTAKWSATSGGAGGESVPTAADNAYFDENSDTGGAFTVTVNVAASCKDFIVGDGVTVTALDQAMTLAQNSAHNVYGSWFNPATNYSRSGNSDLNFLATTSGNTITTNGIAICGSGFLTFNGSGGVWTLASSLASVASFRFYAGTLNTAGFNLSSFVRLEWTGGTVNLDSSQITLTQTNNSNAATIRFEPALILDAGTSTFNITVSSGLAPGGVLNFAGKTLYDVIINRSDLNFTVQGANTFNDLNVINARSVVFDSGQTTNGTLTLRGDNTNITSRTRIAGPGVGGSQTLTCAAITIGDGVDFQQIEIAGDAAPLDVSTKSTGDAGGNSGITGFAAPKTVYWNLAGSQNWSATAWATTPTGTPAVENFPLAQDTAVVTEAGAAGTITLNSAWSIGTLTFDDGVSPRTSAVTLNITNGPVFYGDLKLSSGAIISGTATATFAGLNTQNITGAGKTFTNSITLDSPGGTLVLQDNLTLDPTRTFTLTRGTLDLNGRVPSFGIFNSSNTNVRSIAFGNSKIQLSGAGTTIIELGTSTNFTYTGSGLFELTYTGSAGTRTVNSFSTEEIYAPNLRVIGGTDFFSFTTNSSRIWNNVDFTGFSGSLAGIGSSLTFVGNVTFSATMTFAGTGNGITFGSVSKNQLLTTNGMAVNTQVGKINAGTLTLQDNLVLSNPSFGAVSHVQGTINLNGRTLTCLNWSSSNANIRALIFGAGQLILGGTGFAWNTENAINYTITPGTGKIVLANNTNTARTFAGGGILTFPELEIGGDTGTATTTITGANGFAKLTNTKQVAYTIVFSNVETRVANWNLNGSEGNLITLSRTGASGTFTIRYTGGSFALGRYLSISNSTALPANRLYAIYSTDGGGNTGWVFDAPKFAQFINFFDIV